MKQQSGEGPVSRSHGLSKIHPEKNILLYVSKLTLHEVIPDTKYDFIACDMHEVAVGYKPLSLPVILKWVSVELSTAFDHCNNEVPSPYSAKLKNKVRIYCKVSARYQNI